MEVEPAIDPLVCTLLLLNRARSDESQGPPLKLIRVFSGQGFGVGKRYGFPDYLIECSISEGVPKAVFDKGDRQVGDINTNPMAVKALGDRYGGPAPTERIKNRISGVTTSLYYPFKESLWLLSCIAQALLCYGVDGIDLRPNIINLGETGAFRKVLLVRPLGPFLLWGDQSLVSLEAVEGFA